MSCPLKRPPCASARAAAGPAAMGGCVLSASTPPQVDLETPALVALPGNAATAGRGCLRVDAARPSCCAHASAAATTWVGGAPSEKTPSESGRGRRRGAGREAGSPVAVGFAVPPGGPMAATTAAVEGATCNVATSSAVSKSLGRGGASGAAAMPVLGQRAASGVGGPEVQPSSLPGATRPWTSLGDPIGDNAAATGGRGAAWVRS